MPESVDVAVRAADALMYDAKRRGRNIVTYGSDTIDSADSGKTEDPGKTELHDHA